MTIYILLYCLILGVEFFRAGQQRELSSYTRYFVTPEIRSARQQSGWLIIAVSLTLVIGLRHPSMGWDLQYGLDGGYLQTFRSIAYVPLNEVLQRSWLNYEKGYVLFNKLISYISDDTQFLLIMCAICTFIPVGLLIKNSSREIPLSYIVFIGLPCFLMPFSGLRQGIAIGLCCLNCINIKEKKKLRFILVLLLSTWFHYSCFAFALAYPLYHIKVNKVGRIASVIILLAVYILRYPIFAIASRLFKDNAEAGNFGAITLLIVFVMVYIFCFLFDNESDAESSGYLNIFYFACVCQCFGGVYQTAMRVGYYFMPALIIALPNIIHNMDNKNNYLIAKVVVGFAFVLYGLYAIRNSTWAEAYPYYFFWSVA